MSKQRFFLTATAALGLAVGAQSATLYWDGGTADLAASGDGASAGGAGLWNATLLNWDPGAGGPHANWSSATPDSAVLGGVPGLVTLGSPITAGSVTLNAAGYILENGAGSPLFASALAGAGSIRKIGDGALKLTGASPYTGTLTVNHGLVELSSGATLASLAGLTLQGGAGTVGGAAYPFKGVTRGAALYLRDNSGVPGGAQLGSQTLTLDNGSVLWHSGDGPDATALGTVALSGGFNSLAVGSWGNPDVLKIGDLNRADGATVEFRAAYHRMGTGEVQIQITNLNGSAVANTNGILGGWAFVAAAASNVEYGGPARDFAKWDPAATIGSSVGSVVAATPDKANSAYALSTGTPTENWLADSGSDANRTIAADLTINSLIEQADVIINDGATLTLASGGLIFRNNNFWLQTKSGAVGYLTSGINSLYVQTDGGNTNSSDQFIKEVIKDGPAGAVTLRKSGPGLLKLNQINTFSGGTVVNQGTLDLQAGGASGCIRGAVTVNAGAVLRLNAADATGWSSAASPLNSITLNGGNLHVNVANNQTLCNAAINMNGGSITGVANGNIDFLGGGCALNTLASPVTATISGVPLAPLRQGNTTFTVSDGAAAIDLDIASVIRNSPAGGDSGTLTKAGSGTLRLSATNTFTRPVSVSAGTLLVGSSGSLASNTAVTVFSGATLGGSGVINGAVSVGAGGLLAPGGVDAIATLTLANDSSNALTLTGATVACDLSNVAGTSDLLALTGTSGTLVLNGENAIALAFPDGAAPAGTYTLMTYAAKSGSGSLRLFPAHRNATLNVGDTGVTLTVDEGGIAEGSLVWTGDDSANAWNTAASNWLYSSAATTYAENEAVSFDDTGSASPSVNIAPSAVSPGAVTVNNNAKNYTIGGNAISGSASLTKMGAGTLTLTGVNTFTGHIAVNGGTLEAAAATTGNASALGDGSNTITVASGGRLLFTGDRTAGYHAGTVTVNGGTVTGNGSDLSFASGASLTFDTAPGTVDGAGMWRRRGPGNKVVVTASASGSTLSVADLNLYDSAPTFDVADGPSASDLNLASQVTGASVLTKRGAGTLTLTGANTYSGGNELLAGTVSVGAMTGFGTGYIALKFGCAIEYTGTGSETRSGTYWFDNGDAVINVVSPAATLTLWKTSGSHNKPIIKKGAGTLRYGGLHDSFVNNARGSLRVDGGVLESISSVANNAGDVTVNAGGTFRLGTTTGAGGTVPPNCQVWDSGSVTLNAGGTFEQNGMDETVSALNLLGGSTSGEGTLTVTNLINAQSGAASSRLAGAAALAKTTYGTVTLSGANTYSGATAVSAGTLLVNGAHAGGGAYTVATNATLGGAGTISLASGSVTVQAGGRIAPGASAAAGGTLTLSALALEAGATLAINATNDAVAVTGDLALNDTPILVSNLSTFDKNTRYPILTYGGAAAGTPALTADDPEWFIRHDADRKTFFLRTSRLTGTFITLR